MVNATICLYGTRDAKFGFLAEVHLQGRKALRVGDGELRYKTMTEAIFVAQAFLQREVVPMLETIEKVAIHAPGGDKVAIVDLAAGPMPIAGALKWS